MNVKTRALRHEVHHVPSPPDFDFEHDGYHTSDGDTGIYFRPESGNNILIGSEDPDCDPRVWVDEPDKFDRHVTEQQWEAQVFRLARRMPALRIPNERKGIVDLYDVSDDWIPIYDRSVLEATTWRSGRAATSSRTPRRRTPMAELIDASRRARPRRRAGPGPGATTTRSSSTRASTRACASPTRLELLGQRLALLLEGQPIGFGGDDLPGWPGSLALAAEHQPVAFERPVPGDSTGTSTGPGERSSRCRRRAGRSPCARAPAGTGGSPAGTPCRRRCPPRASAPSG